MLNFLKFHRLNDKLSIHPLVVHQLKDRNLYLADSSPSRTINTLTALGRRVVIILGGKSKGLDYSELLPCLKKYAEHIILTGENAQEINSAIREQNPIIVENFAEAVLIGKELAQGVGTLLLSPASTSYDKFKNYEERGRFFKEILTKSTL